MQEGGNRPAGRGGAPAALAPGPALCSLARSLRELCWDKLHVGYWKDVPLVGNGAGEGGAGGRTKC